ncbi:hypothetical protein [Spiroplasma floricola]|uniref:Uncharacterized protein n=1 Tax=Spiroplasma floricola 23-6 TaxID=1336749 RepID=A0A2K8SEZ3_9MOLU|nr:hypothetical protein [Spiroplasma floricola]AUB32002.1 hypothetical protein SFLOR_v1c09540 [Spiroplasma floricola 23-6]
MSVFKALGWLLGVPPAEQRQYSKNQREDYENTRNKLVSKLEKFVKELPGFESFRLDLYISDLVNSFPKKYVFSGSTYIEKIAYKYIDDLVSEAKKPQYKGDSGKYYLIEKWKVKIKRKKTDDEILKIAEEIDQEMLNQKKSEIDKIEMLEKEKRILELEKQIRDLKNSNNRERQR